MVKMYPATGHGSPVTLYDSTDTEIGTAAKPIQVAGTTTENAPAAITLTTAQITISSTAVLLLAANPSRLGATIGVFNASTVYVGQTSGVTSANGVPVPQGSAFNVDFPNYTGALYGILASGTGQLVATAELT